MIYHYLKHTIRNIRNNKLFFAINLFGLSISLTCAFYMLIYLYNELSYDTMHKNRNRIFRIVADKVEFGWKSPGTPYILGPTLKSYFPEIQSFTRVGFLFNSIIKKNNEILNDKVYCADPDLFKILTFPLLKGDINNILTEPNTCVISEKFALKYFNSSDPMNEIIELERNGSIIHLKVCGIMKNISRFSTLNPDIFTSINFALDEIKYTFNDTLITSPWNSDYFYTYILLNENHKIGEVESKIAEFEQKFIPEMYSFKILFQPLPKIYFNSNKFIYNYFSTGDLKSIKIFSLITVLILILASFNYIILSTSQSFRRIKEIAMRKVFVATPQMLQKQILFESVFLTMISIPIAIILIKLFLPNINQLFGINLVFNISESFWLILFFIILCMIVGIIAGLYLAFYLSRLNPISVMQNKATGIKNVLWRKVMIIIQIIIFVSITIFTVIIYRQLHFVYNTDIGFNRKDLILIYNDEIKYQYSALKNELLLNPAITSVCCGNDLPPTWNSSKCSFPDPTNPQNKRVIEMMSVDYDFIKTYQIKFTDGRGFSSQFKSDSNSIIINSAAQRLLNINGPFPNVKNVFNKPIIGVTENYINSNFNAKIPPIAMEPLNLSDVKYIRRFAIRIKPQHKREALIYIEKVFRKFSNQKFEFDFVNDIFRKMAWKEEKQANVLRIFSFLAIFIAVLGLLGLSLFVSMQRRKELCIRKIHGASIYKNVILQIKEYFYLVLIASVIAIPITVFFVNKWLSNFAYHTKIEIWVFVITFLLSLLVVFLTIIWQAWQSAKSNPADVFRYE